MIVKKIELQVLRKIEGVCKKHWSMEFLKITEKNKYRRITFIVRRNIKMNSN